MSLGAAMLGGSVFSGLMGSKAAGDAADAQTAAAQQQLAVQKEMYDTTREDLSPFRESGGLGLDAYLYEMGLGPAPVIDPGTQAADRTINEVSQTLQNPDYKPRLNDDGNVNHSRMGFFRDAPKTIEETYYTVGDARFDTRDAAQAYVNGLPAASDATYYQGFQGSPEYQYQLQEGINAIDASAASRGMLRSGATLEAAQTYGNNLSSLDRENYLNRLSGLGAMGQNAAAQSAAANQNYASGASNAFGNIGNAQAAGAIGQANALSGIFDNVTGVFGYQAATGNNLFSTPLFGAK